MTLKEAALALALDPASLRQAIARGALKATKLGRTRPLFHDGPHSNE